MTCADDCRQRSTIGSIIEPIDRSSVHDHHHQAHRQWQAARPAHWTIPVCPCCTRLRDQLGLHGPHFGCGLAQCGACTVHYDGEALRCCVMPISAVAGAEIVTLEGLGTRGKAASAAAGVHRRTGGAVRLLHQRHDHAGSRAPRDDQAPDRRPGPSRRSQTTCANAAPTSHHARRDARRRADGLSAECNARRTTLTPRVAEDRRCARGHICRSRRGRRGRHPRTPAEKSVDADEVGSFIAIDGNGQVTLYSGKVELGTGVLTAITQIAAEELSVPFGRVTIIQGDTALTPRSGADLRQPVDPESAACRSAVRRPPRREALLDTGRQQVSTWRRISSLSATAWSRRVPAAGVCPTRSWSAAESSRSRSTRPRR